LNPNVETGNENEVGQGIKDSGVPRQDIFITSKLWNTDHPNAAAGLQRTLDALGTDYLDLYVCYTMMSFSKMEREKKNGN
jgi:glycerol 2-dehydrogenase (NADP+)